MVSIWLEPASLAHLEDFCGSPPGPGEAHLKILHGLEIFPKVESSHDDDFGAKYKGHIEHTYDGERMVKGKLGEYHLVRGHVLHVFVPERDIKDDLKVKVMLIKSDLKGIPGDNITDFKFMFLCSCKVVFYWACLMHD